MSIAQLINKGIAKMPLGEPFASSELLKYGSRANIDKILSRLVKAGKLVRVARGIFVKPEQVSYLKTGADVALSSPIKIAETIARSSGEIIATHGAEAARQLQLSTQVPAQPIFLTTGSTRHIKAGNVEILLKHASRRKIANANTIVGLVISALWYFGKKQVNESVIKQIQAKLAPEQFLLLQQSVSFMPGWMANVFYHYQNKCNHAAK